MRRESIFAVKDETLERNYENDIKYIENELIAKQPNGKYCKYSRPLGMVANYNFEKSDYDRYWKNCYKYDEEHYKEIVKAIDDKFSTGLISTDEMINLIEKSKDKTKDKVQALEALRNGTFSKVVKQNNFEGSLRDNIAKLRLPHELIDDEDDFDDEDDE